MHFNLAALSVHLKELEARETILIEISATIKAKPHQREREREIAGMSLLLIARARKESPAAAPRGHILWDSTDELITPSKGSIRARGAC